MSLATASSRSAMAKIVARTCTCLATVAPPESQLDLIAGARNALPLLIGEVRRLRAE